MSGSPHFDGEFQNAKNLRERNAKSSHRRHEKSAYVEVPGNVRTLWSRAKIFGRVVTGHETWTFEYDPESKCQNSEWHTKTFETTCGVTGSCTTTMHRTTPRYGSHQHPLVGSVSPTDAPELLAKMGVETLPQPPYSSDLASSDFFLFLKIKRTLMGDHNGTLDEVKKTPSTYLREVSVEAFQAAYEEWVKRWKICIESGEE